MPNENYTHITFIVDRSGSMSSIANSMREGFDEFINGQLQVESEATVTIARFDNEYEIVQDMVSIDQVGPLELSPRGMTALLDGIGRSMNTVRSQIHEMPNEDKPSKCIFIIITDGQENASKEYSRDQVFEMIEDCRSDEEIDYEFVFLGANQDAISAGSSFGIRADTSMSYCANDTGTKSIYNTLSAQVTSYRTKGTFKFTDEDRLEAMGENQNPIVPDLHTEILKEFKK